MIDLGPNVDLIAATPEIFARNVATPALCIDLPAFRRNLSAMQSAVSRAGKALRPHMKGHKSIHVARLQQAAGAVGIACATAKEARVAMTAGITDVLITTPVLSPAVLAALAASRPAGTKLTVAVDSILGADQLAAAFAGLPPVGVLVDLNVGQNRTGLASPGETLDLARYVASQAALNYLGIQAYYGHLQHVPTVIGRLAQIREQWVIINAIVTALSGAGLRPTIVSGGGTGTAALDLSGSPLTEIQPGSYLFMDSQYGAVEFSEDSKLEVALSVLARITSATTPGQIIIDAGTKSISTDKAEMRVLTAGLAGAVHKFMGDEHSALSLSQGAALPQLGDLISLQATHCDPTVNLHDRFHVVEGGRLVDIWPIEARGY